jgi:general secretion pathway protein L
VLRFLAWWSDELSDIAAARASRAHGWKVMLVRREGGCDIYLRARDRIEHIGTSRGRDDRVFHDLRRRLGRRRIAPAEIVLRLAPGEVVQTRLSVPAAAGDVLEPIVRNQIERLAPWPADRALFAYVVAASDTSSATLDVQLTVAGRSQIEGLVTELGDAGLTPGVVDVGTDTGQEPRLNLLAARGDAGRRLGRILLASVGVLCAAAVMAGIIAVVMLLQERRELGLLNARLQALQDKAAAELPSQASLRRQAWLAAQRGSQPSMAIALEGLSRALPDDAWLDRLEVEHGVARLGGHAVNAAALIGRIEASGHFADVKFAAPTMLGEEDKRESFTISGRIVPGRRLDR